MFASFESCSSRGSARWPTSRPGVSIVLVLVVYLYLRWRIGGYHARRHLAQYGSLMNL
jgi:hypothetical protein